MAHRDPVADALTTATPTEARAVIEALAGWVEDMRDDEANDPLLAAGEALLERLNAARASLA